MLTYKGDVLDKDLSTPPELPTGSGSYIVGPNPTGDWTGHEKEIATSSGSYWLFTIPRLNWKLWVEDEALFYLYDQDERWSPKNSVADYIPLAQREKDFWVLTTTLIERKVADLDPEMRKIATKWDAIDEFDRDSLESIISEMGYGYISAMFLLNNQQLQSLVNFLNLIHYLKGARAGLELVFSLMGVQATIKEWWELTYADICEIFGILDDSTLTYETDGDLWTPNVEPHTFFLTLQVPSTMQKDETAIKVRAFCRNYVYPKLVRLTIQVV